MSRSIRLFWFSKVRLQGGSIENFGDVLSERLVHKISGKKVVWNNPKECNWFQNTFSTTYLAIGSILHFATDNCIIWGSGLIDSGSVAPNAHYLAVRGPETLKNLRERGFNVPEVYGDPGLLTSRYFPLEVSKQYPLGIIPHYTETNDFKAFADSSSLAEEVKIIDLREDVRSVITDILSCEAILSSSLHGLIVPMSYGIPSYRFNFSDKIYGDGIKYRDYYKSVGIEPYDPIHFDPNDFNVSLIIKKINKEQHCSLIQNDLVTMQDNLLSVCPF